MWSISLYFFRIFIFQLEERLREWLEQNDQISNPWMALLSNWEEQVTPALKFLSGIDQGMY